MPVGASGTVATCAVSTPSRIHIARSARPWSSSPTAEMYPVRDPCRAAATRKFDVSPPKPCTVRPPARLNSTIASPRARTSIGAGVGAAIDQDVLAGDVAGVRAAKEGARRTEFLRAAEAQGRDRLAAQVGHFVHRLSAFLRAALQRRAQAVGVECAGQEVVDRDVRRCELLRARDTGDEAGEAAAR